MTKNNLLFLYSFKFDHGEHLHILAREVTNCPEQTGAVKAMIHFPFEPLDCGFEDAVSSFTSLLAEDSQANLLLTKECLHMAGKDVDLPGWFEHFSA